MRGWHSLLPFLYTTQSNINSLGLAVYVCFICLSGLFFLVFKNDNPKVIKAKINRVANKGESSF